jgi:hypothetical protein
MSPQPTLDLETLGFDRGAHLLVEHALNRLAPGERLGVSGTDPALGVHLRAWCRARGHPFELADTDSAFVVERGQAETDRWHGATRAGAGPGPASGPAARRPVADRAEPAWGLAARGALVEAGGPEPRFDLDERTAVWADTAPRLYAQAVAAQWDPATAVDWDAPFELPDEVEDAVVQVMTYLIEN